MNQLSANHTYIRGYIVDSFGRLWVINRDEATQLTPAPITQLNDYYLIECPYLISRVVTNNHRIIGVTMDGLLYDFNHRRLYNYDSPIADIHMIESTLVALLSGGKLINILDDFTYKPILTNVAYISPILDWSLGTIHNMEYPEYYIIITNESQYLVIDSQLTVNEIGSEGYPRVDRIDRIQNGAIVTIDNQLFRVVDDNGIGLIEYEHPNTMMAVIPINGNQIMLAIDTHHVLWICNSADEADRSSNCFPLSLWNPMTRTIRPVRFINYLADNQYVPDAAYCQDGNGTIYEINSRSLIRSIFIPSSLTSI